ncbi:MAG: hypothetical protein QOH84_2594 [Kribbellaceae bacterium]|jgi:hypothetical protein|nr:hypothetical protein [Kribbellaceae bacterium]
MKIFRSKDRKPSPELVTEAARTPGGWVYDIDADWVDDPGQVVRDSIEAGMDEPEARERSWLDLGATMEQIGPLLETRLHDLDQTG